jgi:hypothetical protein
MKLIKQHDNTGNVLGDVIYYLAHDESPDLPDTHQYKAIAFGLEDLPALIEAVQSIQEDLRAMVSPKNVKEAV